MLNPSNKTLAIILTILSTGATQAMEGPSSINTATTAIQTPSPAPTQQNDRIIRLIELGQDEAVEIPDTWVQYCDYLYTIVNNPIPELSVLADNEKGKEKVEDEKGPRAYIVHENGQAIIVIKLEIQQELLAKIAQYLRQFHTLYIHSNDLYMATDNLADYIADDLGSLKKQNHKLIPALVDAADKLCSKPLFNALAVRASRTSKIRHLPNEGQLDSLMYFLEKGIINDKIKENINSLVKAAYNRKLFLKPECLKEFIAAMVRFHIYITRIPIYPRGLSFFHLADLAQDGIIHPSDAPSYRARIDQAQHMTIENLCTKENIYLLKHIDRIPHFLVEQKIIPLVSTLIENMLTGEKPDSFDLFVSSIETFELRRFLLTTLVKLLKKKFSFKEDDEDLHNLFSKLPEGFVKMALRFIFADANNGTLIDAMDINHIRQKIPLNTIDLSNCFTDHHAPLIKYLMIFIQLARPLYPSICEITHTINDTYIDLGNNQLSQLLPEIGQCSTIHTLDLSHNNLTKLPQEIVQLVNLGNLNLSHNEFSNFPAEITQLCHLYSLDLSNNKLSKLSADIKNLSSLSSLHLNNNQFTQFPQEICELRELQNLHLCDNKLTQLPPEIGQLSRLSTLYIRNNLLTQLPAKIGQLECLHILSIIENPQLAQLPDSLEHIPNLTTEK